MNLRDNCDCCDHSALIAALLGMLQDAGFVVVQMVAIQLRPLFYLLSNSSTNQAFVLFCPVNDKDEFFPGGPRWSLRDALSCYQQILNGNEDVEADLVRQLKSMPYFVPVLQMRRSVFTVLRRVHWCLMYSDGNEENPVQFIDSKCYLGYSLGYVERAVKEFMENGKLHAVYLATQPALDRSIDSGLYVVCTLQRVVAAKNIAAPVAVDGFAATFKKYYSAMQPCLGKVPVSNCRCVDFPEHEKFVVRHKFAITVTFLVMLIVALVMGVDRLTPILLLLLVKLGWAGILVGQGLLHSFIGAGLGIGKASTAVAASLPIIAGIFIGSSRWMFVSLKSMRKSLLHGVKVPKFSLEVPEHRTAFENAVKGSLGTRKMIKGPQLALFSGVFANNGTTASVATSAANQKLSRRIKVGAGV